MSINVSAVNTAYPKPATTEPTLSAGVPLTILNPNHPDFNPVASPLTLKIYADTYKFKLQDSLQIGNAYNRSPNLGSTTKNMTLKDTQRNRTLDSTIYYPSKAGTEPLPVIFFSHGMTRNSTTYQYLCRDLAEQGYVVIAPNHPGSDTKTFMEQPFDELVEAITTDPQVSIDRAKDISFLIDSLDSIDQSIPVNIDKNAIAVSGHALGASTALIIGGATLDLPGAANTSFKDPRVKVVVPISPQGAGIRFMDEGSFTTMNTPFLTISGSKDQGQAGPAERLDALQYSPDGKDRFHLLIRDAEHSDFSVNIAPITKDITKNALGAFFDGYLKNNLGGKNYVQLGGMDRYMGVKTAVVSR